MNRSPFIAAVAALAFLSPVPPAFAADTGTVAGVWWTANHDGKIAIEIDDTGVIGGRLIAVTPEDAQAVDANNPDTKLRFRPLIGLPVLRGFTPNADDGAMTGGTIYDPDTGKTYYGSLSLDQDGKLVLRESVAFSLFWRTEVLQRVDGSHPEGHQDGEPDLAYSVPPASAEPPVESTPKPEPSLQP
jgi:uncharacterized protein (DUF2147 family)